MHSNQDVKDAAALYAIIYHGANLYNVKNKPGRGDQALNRWVEIARRFNEYKEQAA